MSRFIEVNADLINVDHIVRVHQQKDCALRIFLDDGTVIKTDHGCEQALHAIVGRDHIVASVPCEGIYVAVDCCGDTCYYPLRHLAVTADGEVRPLSVQFDVVEFYDDWPGFRGMTSAPAESDGSKIQDNEDVDPLNRAYSDV